MPEEQEPLVRQKLVAAALDVIATRGWDGASTRHVAAQAGVTPGLVHYHFGSIEHLRLEAVDLAMSAATAPALDRLLSADDLTTGLELALGMIAGSGNDPHAAFLVELLMVSRHSEAVRQRVLLASRAVEAALAARLRVWLPAPPSPAAGEADARVLASLLDGLTARALMGDLDDETIAAAVRWIAALAATRR